ncbi:zinc-binding dehydrogenase [Paenibacillus sp.]|uniref:zinc-binding dehydrogenase n=1 Tax=Paenibacillus sp. TaxID=58172 RepID=UPI002D5BC302|nr:zinc-binding dehydrogenase [Paenibacillus sp.]HZG58108.1 zinc-binding dehydrogenase [Paenibacillus sp.]
MLTAEACRIAGAADITLVDINERRLGMARALGYATARDALALRDDVKFDFVFETTGASAVLEPALHMVRIKGTVVIVGKYDIDPPFDLHTVLFKEITVKGARVYREGEFLTAVRLLASDPHRFGRLITDCFALDEAELMIGAFRSKSNVGKLMIIM